MMPDILKGEAFGVAPEVLMAEVRKAAKAGNRAARMFLAAMRERNLKAGRAPGSKGITVSLLKTWRCPTCSAAAASASGRADTVRCRKGHTHPANPEAWAVYLKGVGGPVNTVRRGAALEKTPAESGAARLLRPPARKAPGG